MKQSKMAWAVGVLLLCLLVLPLCSGCRKAETAPQESEESTAQPSQSGDGKPEEEPIVLGDGNKTMIYFNDPGHISNQSPYNPSRSRVVTRERLEAAVTEATSAGFDVFVNEVYGMVPSYPSEVYPLEEHLDWFYNEFGGKGSDPFITYTQNGNDFMQVQLDKTHEEGKLFFISYRMNDMHGTNLMYDPETAPVRWTSRFTIEHQEYAIGEAQQHIGLARYMLDFQYSEVRDYKLSMIAELIRNYDIDGLLLDFMRAPAYFNLSTTTAEQRERIITEFVAEVRGMLDAKSAETGKDYYFGVIIPLVDSTYENLGIDVDMLYDAGARVFLFWDYYMTVQDYRWLGEVKSRYQDLIAYAEVSQATSYLKGSNPNQVRYTTAEQFYTSAHLAYAHGADGMAVFNFPFYRNWQYGPDPNLGYEPPFEIVENLKNPEFLQTAPQHYFIGYTYNYAMYPFSLTEAMLSAGKGMVFEMDMAAPTGGWKEDGVLRLEGSADLTGVSLTVRLNGVTLASTPNTGEPYDTPYHELIGPAERMQCFAVPADLLEEGVNRFEVSAELSGSATVSFVFIDLAIQ